MKAKILFVFFVILGIYLFNDQRFALEIFVGLLPFATIGLWQRKVSFKRDKNLAFVAWDISMTVVLAVLLIFLSYLLIEFGKDLGLAYLIAILILELLIVVLGIESFDGFINQKAIYLFMTLYTLFSFVLFQIAFACAVFISLLLAYFFFVPKRIGRIVITKDLIKYGAWRILF